MDPVLNGICEPRCGDSNDGGSGSCAFSLAGNPEAWTKLATALGRLHRLSADGTDVEEEVGQIVHAFGLDLRGLACVALDFLPTPGPVSTHSFFDTFDSDVLVSAISWRLEQSYKAEETPPDSLCSVVASLIGSKRVDLGVLGAQLRPLPNEVEGLVLARRSVLEGKLECVAPGSLACVPCPWTVGGERREGAVEGALPKSVLARYHDDNFLQGHPALSLAAYYLRRAPAHEADVLNALALFKHATGSSSTLKDEALSCTVFRESVISHISHAVHEACLTFFGDPSYLEGDACDYWNGGSLLPFLPLDFVFILGRHFHKSIAACKSLCWVLAYEAKNMSNFDSCKRRWGDVFDRILIECLLPAHACSHSDDASVDIGHRIDDILKLLPPGRCFAIMSKFVQHANMEGNDIVGWYYRIGKWGPKQVLKRVVVSEGCQDQHLVTAFGNAAKMAPFSIVDEIMDRVLHGDPFWISGYIELMQDWPSFAFSALAHRVIEAMTSTTRAKINRGGFAPWVDSLSDFIVKVCTAYPDKFPIEWVMVSVCNEISHMEYGVVKILAAILRDVMGVRTTSLVEQFPGSFFSESCCTGFKHIPQNELDALAGGPLLTSTICKTSATEGITNRFASVRTRVMNALTEPLRGGKPKAGEFKNRISILVVFLLKCIEKVPYLVHTPNIRVVMGLTDCVADAYVQSVAAFSATTRIDGRNRLLPAISDLVDKAKCNPYWACLPFRGALTESVLDEDASTEGSSSQTQKGHDALDKLVKAVRKVDKFKQGGGAWDCLPAEFFTLFWTLSLQDVTVPERAYKEAKEIVEDKLAACEKHADPMISGEAQTEHWKSVLRELKEEHAARKTRVKKVEAYLRKRKDTLLGAVQESDLADLQMALIDHCIWPRIKMGAEEGRFAWEFIALASRIGIVNFPVIALMEISVKRLLPMMHALTEKEGAGFRVYFREVLAKANAWRVDKSLFQYECGTKPGCKWIPDMADSAGSESCAQTKKPGKIEAVDHERFLSINYRWNTRSMRVLRDFLDPLVEDKQHDYLEPGGDFKEKNDLVGHRYILRKSALLLMNNIREIYPLLRGAAMHLVRWTAHISEWDRHSNVQSLALTLNSYMKDQLETIERWSTLQAFGGCPEDVVARERAARQKEAAKKEDCMDVDERRGRKHSRDEEGRESSRQKSRRVGVTGQNHQYSWMREETSQRRKYRSNDRCRMHT